MLLEVCGCVWSLVVGPLVNGVCRVAREDRCCHPFLEDQPGTNVDSAQERSGCASSFVDRNGRGAESGG